jgi:hypothetical protein
MEPSTEVSQPRSDVFGSFLTPFSLLHVPTVDDSPELRRQKDRRNSAWLKRWLPTYIRRWAFIFLAMWLTTLFSSALGLPALVDAILEFGQFASAGMGLGLIWLYVLARTAAPS